MPVCFNGGTKVEKYHAPIKIMEEILKAVLVDPSVRNAEAVEALAVVQAEFLTWQ